MGELSSRLASIGEDMQRLQAAVRKAIETEADPGLREHMQELNQLMTESFDKVQETLPAAEAELDQEIQAISDTKARVEKEIAETRAKLDERVAEVAAAGGAVPVPIPFDPGLGKQLCDELLERFAPKQDVTARPGLQDFSVEFDPVTQETAQAEAVPVAPALMPASEMLPASVVSGMLIFGKVTKTDVVYHPGCGDGRLLISAASRFQASGVGLENDPAASAQALENVRKTRLKGLITIKQADYLTASYAAASIVFLTMDAAANARLLGVLRKQVAPGTRIVAYAHPCKDWPHLAETTVQDEKGNPHRLYIWVHNPTAGSVANISSWEWE